MFRNNIHPITLFSAVISSFALLAIASCIQMYAEMTRYRYDLESSLNWTVEELGVMVTVFAVGCFFLVGALGLLLRKNWARLLLQLGLLIAGLGWLTFMSMVLDGAGRHFPWAVMIGITACVLGLIIGSILFLNNRQWVLPYLSGTHDLDRSVKVLDQDW